MSFMDPPKNRRINTMSQAEEYTVRTLVVEEPGNQK